MRTSTLTPYGIANEDKWDRRFIELARHVAGWSKDPSTQVGSVLVNGKNRVVGIGYNGFPAGCNDDAELYANRELKYKRVVHAEVNAILDAGKDAVGARMYNYPSFAIPCICTDCAKFAIQAGISQVIGYPPNEKDKERTNRKRSDGSSWAESIALAKEMLDEAGVVYRAVQPEVVGLEWAPENAVLIIG